MHDAVIALTSCTLGVRRGAPNRIILWTQRRHPAVGFAPEPPQDRELSPELSARRYPGLFIGVPRGPDTETVTSFLCSAWTRLAVVCQTSSQSPGGSVDLEVAGSSPVVLASSNPNTH